MTRGRSFKENLAQILGYTMLSIWIGYSVTRLGDLLNFGQVFKAIVNNQFAQISHIIRQFL